MARAGRYPLTAWLGRTTWAALFGTPSCCAGRQRPRPRNELLRRVIDVAAREEQQHVREVPLGSNRGPRVDQYLRAAGIDPEYGQLSLVRQFHCVVL